LLVHALQRHASLRGVAYLAGAATVLRGVSAFYSQWPDVRPYMLHLTILPFGAAWTYAFVRLRDEDIARWKQTNLCQGLRQVGTGMALGAGAFLLVVGTAAAMGWARFSSISQVSPTTVTRTLLVSMPAYMAGAWNEEMVFRGYGLDTANAAIGRPASIMLLTTLFAWGHSRSMEPLMLIGLGAGGLAMVALRYRSNGLWMPVGYHFAWNYIQTVLISVDGGLPSLGLVEFTGPKLWVGRPGYPEPGLIAVIVSVLIAFACSMLGRRRK